jgi:hypothetical protein
MFVLGMDDAITCEPDGSVLLILAEVVSESLAWLVSRRLLAVSLALGCEWHCYV